MQTNYVARAAANKSSDVPTPMEALAKSADAGVTPAGRMAIALTMIRNSNARVMSGTAMASPIFAGLDNDLEPEHRAARQAKRRAAHKAQRAARARGRRS